MPSCSYAWQQSKTSGWQWQAGLNLKLPSGLSKAWSELAALTPSYNRSGSTPSYTFTTNLKPGQFAQPIQVVERRWTQGVYHSTGKRCLSSPSNPNHSPPRQNSRATCQLHRRGLSGRCERRLPIPEEGSSPRGRVGNLAERTRTQPLLTS